MKVGNKPPKMPHCPSEGGHKPPQMPNHPSGHKPSSHGDGNHPFKHVQLHQKPGEHKPHGEPPKPHSQDPMHKSPFKEHFSNNQFSPNDMHSRLMSMKGDGNL